jgi:predicted Fe-Mo cluster-binding NifX family protein
MKIAIAAEAATPQAKVSHHGARAPYYLVYDESGQLQQALSNPYAGAERGAGPGAAQFLARHGIRTIVAADFGGRFIDELEADGINYREAAGIVSDIIKDIVNT